VPADLDELFIALGREADTLPLAPASAARRRGERRRRNQVVAAAVAVLLVIAGAGAAGWWIDHERRPVLPAGPVRGLEPVGEPVPLTNTTAEAGHATWIDGGRVYLSTILSAQAVDARSSKPLWSAGTFHFGSQHDGPFPYAGSLLMLDGTPATTLYVHDAASGARRWTLPLGAEDPLLLADGLLIRMAKASGVTEAFDVSTGEKRWSAPAGKDRPIRIAGMQNSADGVRLDGQPEPGSWRLPGFEISGDRLVQLTRSGRLLVRDAATGKLLHTVRVPEPSLGVKLFAIDGAALMIDHEQVRTTDLSSASGATRVLFDDQRRGSPRRIYPCGPFRLCLDNMQETTVIDSRDGRVWWAAATSELYIGPITARGNRTLASGTLETVLYDEGGRAIFRTDDGAAGRSDRGAAGWIDEGNLLYIGRGAINSVSTVDGKVTRLGDAPAFGGRCAWNAELLACPVRLDGSRMELRIWRFTR
jgi:outer membrane protein assembly factor BamB